MSKTQINIDALTREELYELNALIVDRLKKISSQSLVQQVSKYRMTDIVSFIYEGKQMYGVVKRVNQKSLSLQMTDGSECRVPPSFVTKVIKPPKKAVELRRMLFPTPEEMLEELKREGFVSLP